MKVLLIIFFAVIPLFSFSQKMKDGTYDFRIAYEEWNGKIMGHCKVQIKSDSIIVFKENSSTEKIDSGLLIRHQSGKWIIAKTFNDKFAKIIGACADASIIIDLKKRIIYLC
ncbi:MAG: hypothetical protein RJA07_181 [Bacteroidota bacterium]|jgi:hypothetical protein